MSDIKLLCMDIDGTLTDGRLFIGASGEIAKAFNVKDGYAISNMLPQAGIVPVVITGRQSELVERRCEELSISEVHQGVSNKVACLEGIVRDKGLTLSEVAYIGDDLNDLPCMTAVAMSGGIVGCPNDACREVVSVADFVSESSGGRGAVREFAEWLLSSQSSEAVF